MIPNGTSGVHVYRGSYQPMTSKLIPETPIGKHPQGKAAIKRIQNFSYALSDEIGIGLTARVYKGKNDLTGVPVAIKCIDLKSQKESQQFLKDEIAILERIKATQTYHLLKLEGVLLTNNHLYIITQFCEGKDIAKILRQRKTLTEVQAQSIMKQLIIGYRQLHSMGIIHRDLKLSNLFVTQGKVKLADFGFAISLDKCNHMFEYNVGSPKYMAPQTLKFNLYSIKSQMWALGVIAYELVYGVVPWKHKDDAKLYQLTLLNPIQALFDTNVYVSDHYKTFIVNCLKPNSSDRAGSDFVFNFPWYSATDFVQGFEEEEKKAPELIKIPGKNYAVFSSANTISYQSKQMDVQNFTNSNSMPTQFVILSQLNFCRFLINILKLIKPKCQQSQIIKSLSQQIIYTIQILMKPLGEVACLQKNRFQTPDFDNYIKKGEWQNLKQLIIRYDIQFRGQLQSSQLPKKGATIPRTSILPQSISFFRSKLPQNSRLIDKLIILLEIREFYAQCSPMQTAERVNMAAIVHEALLPDNKFNCEAALKRVEERLTALRL